MSNASKITKEDLDNIIFAYYKHVGNLVNSLEHERIYVEKLCNFVFRPKKGEDRIKDFTNIVRSLKKRNPTELLLSTITRYNNQIENLKKLLLESKELKVRKKEIKIKRDELNRDMES
jgi:hypothetical protein